LLLATILALQIAPAAGEIRTAPCSDCKLRLDTVAVVGDSAGPGELQWELQVFRDASKRLLIAHKGAPSSIAVFDSTGRFLRTIGRPGSGPGEFRRIWNILPYAGGVLVTDDQLRRWTRLDGELRFIDSYSVPLVPRTAVLDSTGAGVVVAVVPTSERVGYFRHLVGSGGQLGPSVGEDRMPYREELHEYLVPDISPATAAGIYWLSKRREYQISRCSARTHDCRRYIRRDSWLPAPRLDEALDENAMLFAPAPRIKAVSDIGGDLLAVVGWIPDRRWQDGLRRLSPALARIEDFNKHFDTRLDLVDSRSMNVVSTARFDMAIWGALGDGLLWFHSFDPDGRSRVIVVRPHLTTDH
jgi:6-bladed beta-propeller